MSHNSLKPLKTAQKVIILHTLGVHRVAHGECLSEEPLDEWVACRAQHLQLELCFAKGLGFRAQGLEVQGFGVLGLRFKV